MRISDWSSDVCSSDLTDGEFRENGVEQPDGPGGRVTGVENGTVQRGDAIVHVAERGVLARCERGDEGSGNMGGGGLRLPQRLRILLRRPDDETAGNGIVELGNAAGGTRVGRYGEIEWGGV